MGVAMVASKLKGTIFVTLMDHNISWRFEHTETSFLPNPLICCTYESLRCLHLEIIAMVIFVLTMTTMMA